MSQGQGGGQPRKYKTPELMEIAINRYFADCEERDKPATMCGMAMFLGFANRQSLMDYKGLEDKYSFAIKKARQRVEVSVEERLMTRGESVVGCIFNLKNNFGWKDKTEQDVSLNGKLTIAEQIAKSTIK